MYTYKPDIIAKTKIPGHIFVNTSFTSKFVPPAIFVAIQTLLVPIIYFKGNWSTQITIIYTFTYLVPTATAVLGKWFHLMRLLHAPMAFLTLIFMGYLGGVNEPIEFLMIFGISIWFSIYWSIMGAGLGDPAKRMLEILDKVKEGDLRSRVKLNFSREDELGMVTDGINSMLDKLSKIVIEVQKASKDTATGSEELNASAAQISEGSSHQAVCIEEISSSMEEMHGSIKENAENACETSAIAAKVSEDAEKGGRAAKETVRDLKIITEKVLIIEDVVKETNMLALNAAIEAARAGVHGKGFAIVASQIRKLSDRCQKAAWEINKLSASSIERAETTGFFLEKMISGIKKTAELVQLISASNNEQVSGIYQVNTAIQQLDIVLQQNVTATEEMAAESRKFADHAEQLFELTSFFNVLEERKKHLDLKDQNFDELVKKYFGYEKEKILKLLKKKRISHEKPKNITNYADNETDDDFKNF